MVVLSCILKIEINPVLSNFLTNPFFEGKMIGFSSFSCLVMAKQCFSQKLVFQNLTKEFAC